MKKLLIAVMMVLVTAPAYADIFSNGTETNKLKAAMSDDRMASAPFVDPGTILDYVAAIAGYLGTREGFFYDLDNEDYGNYLASTIYTIPDIGVSFSVGMLDTDGAALTVDYNIGALIPAGEVPILSFTEYLYIFAGGAYRNVDEQGWELSPIIGSQLKFTF